MDWASRMVLSWRLSNTPDSTFCVDALEEALSTYGCPAIFNTDQGSQFTSEVFTDVLRSHDIFISLDGKGRWMDNAFIERLWKSVKYGDIYLKAYGSMKELKKGLADYFQFYCVGWVSSSETVVFLTIPGTVHKHNRLQAPHTEAASKKGARGLMQLMPSTAKTLGVQDSFNPEHNIHGGVRYFRQLLDRFGGDVRMALAAYNAGSRKVREYGGGVPPLKSTRYYINRVFSYYNRYKKTDRDRA